MKLLSFTLLLLLLSPFLLLGNDTRIFVSGYVNDVLSGNPIDEHQVTVKFKNQDPPFLFFEKTNTNEFGYFSFLFEIPFTEGVIHVSTVDCSNELITNTIHFGSSQTTIITNFEICYSQQASVCRSDFIYVADPIIPNKVAFKQTALGNINQWQWNFGDGSTSFDPDPVHYYNEDGRFEVCLSVFGNNGNCNDVYCFSIESNDDTLVQARFTYYPVPGNNATMQFHDLSVGNVSAWNWSFGDGRASSVQNPRYTYSSPGEYTVSLIAFKPGNQSDTVSHNIAVSPTGFCQASFITFPDHIDNKTLHFVDVSEGAIESWFWDFGDGHTSSEQHPIHSFASAGIYQIKLTTTNLSENCQDSFYSIQTIADQPDYLAHFNTFSLEGNDLMWRFTDLSTGNPEKYFWDFGDGNTSEIENPLHTYAAPGVYTVCLTSSDQNDLFSESYCKTIYAGINQDCVAFFSFAPDAINPLIFHFTNTSLGDTLDVLWNFGDGSSSTLSNPSHTFASAGIYKICITVEDTGGFCSDSYCQVITIAPDIMLQAGFEAFIFPENFQTVQFVNEIFGKYDVRIWNFGDGTTSFAQCPQHTYSSEGSYNVCLHVYDIETGLTDQFWKTIEISSEPDCNAGFKKLVSPYNPLSIRFADLSSGEIINRNWNFGDGSISTLKNPVHTFSNGGIFDVCLTIDDYSGTCADQHCEEITIDFEPLCVADFEFTPSQDQSLTISFLDLSQGIMNKWEWDFGDGHTSALQHPEHTYADSGYYNVTLTIINEDSLFWCNHSVSKQIYVFSPLPECFADFVVYPDSGVNKPYLFHFKDLSAGEPDSWFWDFGDGSTSGLQHPTHQYESPGNYQVTLAVSQHNPFGPSCYDSTTLVFSSPDYYHIGGFVFGGLFPINNPVFAGDTAEILLYRVHNNKIMPLDTAHFTDMGYYYSLYLLRDHYLIKAQLTDGSANQDIYFPTYFGNDLMWQDADVCFVADSNHYQLDIHLNELPEMPQGPGSISGSVMYHSFNTLQMIPALKTVVLLFNEQLQPLRYTFTENSGIFDFGGLPFGVYYLAAESAGKICEKYMIVLSEENPIVKDIEIEMFDQGAMPAHEPSVSDESFVRIFPNPVADQLFVQILHEDYGGVECMIANISGQTILRQQHTLLPGKNQLVIATTQLQAGVYFLQIRKLKTGQIKTIKFVK